MTPDVVSSPQSPGWGDPGRGRNPLGSKPGSHQARVDPDVIEHAGPAMTRAMAMATVLAMLCLQGARGLAEEWSSSNRTVAAPREARNKTVPAASKAPKPVVKSKVIESAAEVELENGTGDIDAEGELEREAR